MKKKLVKLLALALSACTCLSVTACGEKETTSNATDALDIYTLYKGYGDDWITSTIELFKQQDWVKEKYPNLKISYETDAQEVRANQLISDGASVNSFDLLFGVNLKGYETTGLIADLTDSVYLADVPGETGKKVIDKIPQSVLEQMYNVTAPSRTDGNKSYYGINYVDGFFGMLYNHDLLVDTLKMEIPVTTNEFLATAANIKTTKYDSHAGADQDTVVLNCANNDYWKAAFRMWWIQYEGLSAYEDYYDGYDTVEATSDSKAVLGQTGRLRSLEVMEDILTQYQYSQSQNVDYKQAQSRFLDGIGIFHFNGDYFSTEMKMELDYLESEGTRYDIRYMKMPVISSIVETLEDKSMSDETLASIIREIDNDVTYEDSTAKTNGVSDADFAKIAAARCIAGNAMASGQVAVVPSYSPAKDLAADFLRFMYTDVAIRNFTLASGISFPTTYDLKADTELYNSIDPIQQSKLAITAGTSNYPYTMLPAGSSLRLGTAGLSDIYFSGKFEVNFAQAANNRLTAAKILEEEEKYWNDTRWSQMVVSALW